jgi:hypothetical protein
MMGKIPEVVPKRKSIKIDNTQLCNLPDHSPLPLVMPIKFSKMGLIAQDLIIPRILLLQVKVKRLSS